MFKSSKFYKSSKLFKSLPKISFAVQKDGTHHSLHNVTQNLEIIVEIMVRIWYPTKTGFFEGPFLTVQFSNGKALAPTIRKPDRSKSGCFFYKMAGIFLDFKCLVFWILDPIQNLDHLWPNLFSTIWNPDSSEFQIPKCTEVFMLDH